jgi:hypothetical protein
MGVAHAPLASDGGSSGCSGSAAGGTERRPITFVEVADCQRPATSPASRCYRSRAAASNATCVRPGGTVLPNFGSPTLFPTDCPMTAAKGDRISLQSIHET